MHLKDLKEKTPADLVSMAEELGVEGASTMRRQDLMFCILRELAEEAGFAAQEEIIPLYLFEHRSGFRYHNFLVTVAVEFEPNINWETQAFDWFEYGKWPEPAHFGLTALLAHEESAAILLERAQT